MTIDGLPPDPEFNEVPTGKYEAVPSTAFLSHVQRPDGSLAMGGRNTDSAFACVIADELEHARLEASGVCFATLQDVTRQRDALQVMYDASQKNNATWGELMEREQADLREYQRRLGEMTKRQEDTQLALDASEMMRETLGAEVTRLRGTHPDLRAAAVPVVPYGYSIQKQIGGWYFLAPGETKHPPDRSWWSSMEEAQLDARNHQFKLTPAMIDPKTAQAWELNPIERKVIEAVRKFLDGYPDMHPVEFVASASTDKQLLSVVLRKRDPKDCAWANDGAPMSDNFLRTPAPKPLTEMRFGRKDVADDQAGPEITPEMIEAGLRVLRGWGALEHPSLADAAIVERVLVAACSARRGARSRFDVYSAGCTPGVITINEVGMADCLPEHADYIDADTGQRPLLVHHRLNPEGPFSARVRAKQGLECCGILPGDEFEVVKDFGDGLYRLFTTGPFKKPSAHFFDWETVDDILELVIETTTYPALATEPVKDAEPDPRPAREPPMSCDHWVITRRKHGSWTDPTAAGPPFRATHKRFDGETTTTTEETMHAETLTGIREKVLRWFRSQCIPAACIKRDHQDQPDIIETWL